MIIANCVRLVCLFVYYVIYLFNYLVVCYLFIYFYNCVCVCVCVWVCVCVCVCACMHVCCVLGCSVVIPSGWSP